MDNSSQVYEDHTLGQVYDVTEEPTTSEEQVYAFTAAAVARHDDANGGGMSDNVFTVDTNQPHVTEVRIESDVCDDVPDFKVPTKSLSLLFS